MTPGPLSNDKVARFVGDHVENIQKAGIAHQSKLLNFLAPSITGALRC